MEYDDIPKDRLKDYALSLQDYKRIGTRLDDKLPAWAGNPNAGPAFSEWNPWDVRDIDPKDGIFLIRSFVDSKTKSGWILIYARFPGKGENLLNIRELLQGTGPRLDPMDF